MFEFIRSHQRLMQFVLLLLILPSFAFFGIEGYMRMVSPDGAVAKVGGLTVSQAEFDAAQREQLERMQQMFGKDFDPKMFDTPRAKVQVLEGLVAQRAIAWEVARNNLGVSNEKLVSTIKSIPAAQENGAFSRARYDTFLASQGMTGDMFDNLLRRDLTTRLVTTVMQETALVPKTVTARLASLVSQQREVAEQVFKPADFARQVQVTDALRKEYYDSHGAEFEIPQQLKIEYLVLTGDEAAKQVTVTPAQIAEVYEQNRKRYEVPEQRRASHILIVVPKDASQKDKDLARAKAEEVLAKVKAAPNDFARLAKQYSQDPGSADKGGDLDFNPRGAMVPAFDDAMFKLQVNEVSGLVQSDFGYHIIRLTGIKPAAGKKLEDVKGEIEAEIVKQQAARKFAELAEQFTNAVYDQSDSLKPAADKFKLEIKTADGVTRVPADPKAPWAATKVINALFGDDALKNKRNTEAIEIAPNTLLSARVVENRPASKRPFDAVQEQLNTRIVAVESSKLARAAGAARLAALRAGTAKGEFGPAKLVNRGSDVGFALEAMPEIFRADGNALPSYTGVELRDGGYGVYRISKVVRTDAPPANEAERLAQTVSGQIGELDFAGYLEGIKTRAKAQLMAPYDAMKTALKAPAK